MLIDRFASLAYYLKKTPLRPILGRLYRLFRPTSETLVARNLNRIARLARDAVPGGTLEKGERPRRIVINSHFVWNYGPVEYSLAAALRERGHDVTMIVCGGLPDYCQLQNSTQERPPCDLCLSRVVERFDAYGLPHVSMAANLQPGDIEHARRVAQETPAADLKRVMEGSVNVGYLALGAIGWIDDTKGSLPGIRLSIQIAVACWTLYMLGGLPAIRIGTETYEIGSAGYVLGVLGIVWSINLYNFMDGIDGFAGSQAVIILGTVSILSLYRGNSSLAAVAAIFAAACVGFLIWNWPPAKIFLGDVGSGAIGYLVCGLAIASENNQSVPLFVFAILGAVFIADSTVTLVRRLRRGVRKIEAHRDHAYQRLAQSFGSHRPVTIGAAGATSVLAVLATIGTVSPRLLPGAFIAACLFVAILLIISERRAPLGKRGNAG